MKSEDKQLLFADLCARLPYHVRCKVWLEDGTTEEGSLDLQHNYGDVLQDAFYYDRIKDIKPYLRPMSSMTEGEEEEYYNTFYSEDYGGLPSPSMPTVKTLDFLLRNHFDYRGLIDKGLAIKVTEENNPYKD